MIFKYDNDNLEIDIIKNNKHEFCLTANEVAKGYGVSIENVRSQKMNHNDELIENQHFINNFYFFDGKQNRKTTVWTKRGVIRLGFFIKSERAKKFRDWVENLIIYQIDSQFSQPISQPQTQNLQLPEIGNSTQKIIELDNNFIATTNLLANLRNANPIDLFRLDQFYREFHNFSPLQAFKIDLENQFFLPTELGRMINKSPVEINLMLANKGFQIRENGVWKMTSSGEEFGILINGKFIQIKWKMRTVL